ncbi:hypothetical protein BDN70DRAFT_823695 [Pholiota conissans]|uniref:RRM Nup35-type domain-containing protein n=1 Tax=Pholiota conissans TaxID=109636 RepID=A0A9P6D751_9AGAR|nr:hypothetical protein BDN70DRAFT_823695 [Pholiota conissans]
MQHSHSHSPFSVAGMSSSTSSHSSPNLNTWGSTSTGGPLAASFGDSLSQSRSHYQSGYLMSTTQNNNMAQGKQRVDETPVVQTKAKMNQILSRGTSTDFGMDSMFQSSKQRQTLDDEDAPPTTSINDIPNEINIDSPARFAPRKTTTEKSPFTSSRRGIATSPPSNKPNQPIYIVVFGYPPDKYSVAVEYFMSLGETTNPEPNPEISNCFKLGYLDPSDAMRAVRKNGEIVAGSWMVGAKLADPSQLPQLDSALQITARSPFAPSAPQNQQAEAANAASNAMNVDEPYSPFHSGANTPSLGTPIRLAPSMAAFRKTPAIPASASKPATPQSAWVGGVLPSSASAPAQPTPSKSVMGQVSDLIFGW